MMSLLGVCQSIRSKGFTGIGHLHKGLVSAASHERRAASGLLGSFGQDDMLTRIIATAWTLGSHESLFGLFMYVCDLVAKCFCYGRLVSSLCNSAFPRVIVWHCCIVWHCFDPLFCPV